MYEHHSTSHPQTEAETETEAVSILASVQAIAEDLRAELATLDDNQLGAVVAALAAAYGAARSEVCRREPPTVDGPPKLHGGQVALTPWGARGYALLFDDEISVNRVDFGPRSLLNVPVYFDHRPGAGQHGRVIAYHIDNVGVWIDCTLSSVLRSDIASEQARGGLWGWSMGAMSHGDPVHTLLICEFSLTRTPHDTRQIEERKHREGTAN